MLALQQTLLDLRVVFYVDGLRQRPAVEISDAVLLRLRRGFKPGQSHPLMHAVAAAICRAVDDLGAVDQETLRIADSMLGTSTLRMVSQFAFAESLGISRRRVAPRIRTASPLRS